jgi:hypothetical protein
MTAYQGARPRTAVLPARRRIAAPVRAGRRSHPVGLLLAAVVVTFLLGLIYLAQTIQLAATNYEVDQLLAERDDLLRQVQTVETTIVRFGAEPLVLERAQLQGFDPLGARIRVPAR